MLCNPTSPEMVLKKENLCLSVVRLPRRCGGQPRSDAGDHGTLRFPAFSSCSNARHRQHDDFSLISHFRRPPVTVQRGLHILVTKTHPVVGAIFAPQNTPKLVWQSVQEYAAHLCYVVAYFTSLDPLTHSTNWAPSEHASDRRASEQCERT